MKNTKLFIVSALIVIGMLFMVSCTSTTYTVSFDPNGGEPTYFAPQTVASGSLAKDPGSPKKAGSTFIGWFAKGKTTAWNFASDKVTTNVVLTANWEAEPTHKVTAQWEAYATEKTGDIYFVALIPIDPSGALKPSASFIRAVPAGTTTKYSFELSDSEWKGYKFMSRIYLRSEGEFVAAAKMTEDAAVLFDGTKDVDLPKLKLATILK